MTDNLPGGFISDMDQLMASVESTAEIVAIYYKALLDKHIPNELVEEMTREVNKQIWGNIFNQARQQND